METKQLSRSRKLKLLEDFATNIENMLNIEGYRAYANNVRLETDEDIKNYINTQIDIEEHLNIKLGDSISCLRTSCNNAIGANFYTYKGTTLYKCHRDCNCINDTVSLFDLIVEVYKQQIGVMDYNAAMHTIKMQLVKHYQSKFYKEFEEIIEHNRQIIRNLHHKKYLAQLFKRRNLMETLEDFTELALIYMKEDEEIPYSFYCSQSVIKRTYQYVFKKNGGSYQVEKINLLATLGLIEKLDEDNCGKRMRKKIIRAKTIAGEGKGYMKATTAYRVHKITLEDIAEAERLAKIILENKIYKITKETIDNVLKQNKDTQRINNTFVKRAKRVIKAELKAKNYIQVHKVVSKIDPKYKFYKTKQEKERLLEENLKRIISEYKLEIILVNKNARDTLKLTRSVKDNTEILIRRNFEIKGKLTVNKDNEVVLKNCENIQGNIVNYEINNDLECDEEMPF